MSARFVNRKAKSGFRASLVAYQYGRKLIMKDPCWHHNDNEGFEIDRLELLGLHLEPTNQEARDLVASIRLEAMQEGLLLNLRKLKHLSYSFYTPEDAVQNYLSMKDMNVTDTDLIFVPIPKNLAELIREDIDKAVELLEQLTARYKPADRKSAKKGEETMDQETKNAEQAQALNKGLKAEEPSKTDVAADIGAEITGLRNLIGVADHVTDGPSVDSLLFTKALSMIIDAQYDGSSVELPVQKLREAQPVKLDSRPSPEGPILIFTAKQ